MQLRKYSLVFLTTTFLVALTGKCASAISLAGSTQGFTSAITLDSGATLTVTGDPVSLLPIPNQNNLFIRTLSTLFPRWTFTPATSDLPGEFYVDQFLPNNTTGIDANGVPAVYVGTNFQFRYIPPQDVSLPQPNPDTLHWIQRVTNYNFAGRRGTQNNFIDVPSNQLNPFYDLNPGIDLPDKYTF